MSGKGSRERRKEAIKQAKDDVYSYNGSPPTKIVYPNDVRMQRIYESSLAHWAGIFTAMEREMEDLEEIYGPLYPDMRSPFK